MNRKGKLQNTTIIVAVLAIAIAFAISQGMLGIFSFELTGGAKKDIEMLGQNWTVFSSTGNFDGWGNNRNKYVKITKDGLIEAKVNEPYSRTSAVADLSSVDVRDVDTINLFGKATAISSGDASGGGVNVQVVDESRENRVRLYSIGAPREGGKRTGGDVQIDYNLENDEFIVQSVGQATRSVSADPLNSQERWTVRVRASASSGSSADDDEGTGTFDLEVVEVIGGGKVDTGNKSTTSPTQEEEQSEEVSLSIPRPPKDARIPEDVFKDKVKNHIEGLIG